MMNSVCCINLSSYGKLYVVNGEKLHTDLVKEAVRDIYKEENLEIKQKEENVASLTIPESFSEAKAVATFARILELFYLQGWKAILSVNLSENFTPNCLLFHKTAPEYSLSPIFALTFKDENKIELVGAPPNIVEFLLDEIRLVYAPGVEKHKQLEELGYKITLCSAPWSKHGFVVWEGRRLILSIISKLRNHGYNFYGCVDLTGSKEDWYFFVGNTEISEEPILSMAALEESNQLTVLNMEPETKIALKNVIADSWSGGLLYEGEFYDGYVFSLGETPWSTTSNARVNSQRLLLDVFLTLAHHGHLLLQPAALDTTKRRNGKNLFIFEKCNKKFADVEIFFMSFHKHGRIHLVGCADSVAERLYSLIQGKWNKGMSISSTCSDIQLHGIEDDNFTSTSGFLPLLCEILELLFQENWLPVCSSSFSTKKHYDNGDIPVKPLLYYYSRDSDKDSKSKHYIIDPVPFDRDPDSIIFMKITQ